MTSFQIKVCGITRKGDAMLAAQLGVDMIGLVFVPGSRRCISVAAAREVSKSLPATIDRVGVFTDPLLSEVLRICDRVGLNYVQLHGAVPQKTQRTLKARSIRVIRAFRLRDHSVWKTLRRSGADLVMIDNSEGSGTSFDWTSAPSPRISNFVLSGGISEKNIAQGVRLFKPLVVDVNSSIESSPGRKSRAKMHSFVAACNEIRYGA